MREIRMVDLQSQYDKIRSEIDPAVREVIESASFINGPQVKRFQENFEKYLGSRHVIPCANGTDALQVAMMALGLQPGDEVITTSFTFIASVEVIALLRLTPVLVDVHPGTFNIDPEAVEKAVTSKTKAIVPVHLFGQCAEMEKLMDIAKKYGLFIIEDTAQAIGADYFFNNGNKKKAGTIGEIGCTSFFPSKNLGCFGDGGALFTDNDGLASKMRSVVNHGMTVRYYHDDVGVNSRLDSIQAAILDVKLKYLDQYNEARQRAASYYDNAFRNNPCLQVPERYEKSSHIFHQYTLITKDIDRNALQSHLQGKGIPAPVYYPVPLHMQKAYTDPRYSPGDFPVTEWLCNHVISLPMHTEFDEEQLEYITGAVNSFSGMPAS
ncbi:MAG: DegT/DnrJ/EryC1/StrS family aminotransferase [Bacteroidota bacterium]